MKVTVWLGLGHVKVYCKVFNRRNNMPLIAWLLGVPLSLVLILMLMGVF